VGNWDGKSIYGRLIGENPPRPRLPPEGGAAFPRPGPVPPRPPAAPPRPPGAWPPRPGAPAAVVAATAMKIHSLYLLLPLYRRNDGSVLLLATASIPPPA
jgi:hypothetical protein